MFLSGLVTLALTPLVKRLALVVGAVDHPGGRRKVHEPQIPRLGGVAIFFAVIISLVLGHWIFPAESRRLASSEMLWLLAAAGCVFLLGIYDDIRGAHAPLKLTVQVGAAALLYFSGERISAISTPFGWMVTLGVFSLPFTVLWLVGLTNGINLLDGIDGLATGVAAIASLTILLVALGQGKTPVALLAAALLGSLLGFLVFNFHPAQIFLGDCGALFLGFLLAAISIMGNQKTSSAVAMGVPIIALGIPIFDTLLALTRRVLRGEHPFRGDRDHLHHRLLALGMSPPRAALTLYAVSGFLAIMALLLAKATRTVAVLILLILGTALVAAMQRLTAGEFRELWRFVRHGERRRRPPRYRVMLVRNTLPLLGQCETGAVLRALLEEVRRELGFETLQVVFDAAVTSEVVIEPEEIKVADPSPPRNRELIFPNGDLRWSGAAEILVGERVVGEVLASKPAWRRSRAGEQDDELLQILADGLGTWLAAHAVKRKQEIEAARAPRGQEAGNGEEEALERLHPRVLPDAR